MVFVDADACPVKTEILNIAKTKGVKSLFVASYYHKPAEDHGDAQWVFVDPDSEAADFYILNHISEGDLLVTQDIGLASLALAKRVYVLSPRGMEYKEDTIETALQFRYLAAKERKQGRFGKGPNPFTHMDRQHFIQSFSQILSNIVRG